MKEKILVTGAIGFIGFHLVEKLVKQGKEVLGIDNINAYYDVRLKYDKLPLLGIDEANLWPNVVYESSKYPNFRFAKLDIKDRYQVENLFRKEEFTHVVNLAAQAGVQYSIQNPHSYIENNITGFINLIDAAKTREVQRFVYASSSSVYGNRDKTPFQEKDNVDKPISIYAASKKANELVAHTYSHLYGLPTVGLRFFTVYGPWGRPDMAPSIFALNILRNKAITVFNQGNMLRDFTYVDDIVEGISRVIQGGKNAEKYQIYNIGNSNPTVLHDFISTLEEVLGTKAQINYKEMRAGDVLKTFSDVGRLQEDYGYKPDTSLKQGIEEFVRWMREYYKL